MKNLFTLLFLMAFGVASMQAQTAAAGDYRSIATGNWTGASTWEVRDGAGAWVTTSTPPSSTNNVYIQVGHTITMTANGACNNLHITKAVTGPPAYAAGTLALATYTLEISGKIRSYTGSAGVPVTGSADGTFYTAQVSGGSPGATMLTATGTNNTSPTSGSRIKFVSSGANRNLTASGEWGALALGTVITEVALASGELGTFGAGFKSLHIIITSGNVTLSNFVVGAGVNGTGSFTLKSGTKWTSGANGSAANNQALSAGSSGSNSIAAGTLTIDDGATIEFNGTAPTIEANTITNNGTIIYAATGVQTLVGKSTTAGSPTGALMNTYNNLTINGTNSIKTLATNVTVNGILTLGTGNKLSLAAFDLTLASAATITATLGSSSHIITGGAGKLVRNNLSTSTPTLFPIGHSTGASSSTYEPFTIKPTNASVNVSANVSATLSGSALDATKISARQWDITPSAAPGATAMTFTPSVLPTAGAPSPPALGHYNTTTSAWEEQRTGVTYASGTLSVANYIGTFSPFASGTEGAFSSTVLGVELSKFDVKSTKNAAILTWTTASEKDNATFNIEQSTNGTDFQTVGQVKGRGTTSVATDYNFEHSTPSVGVNYYRLKQVDFNGTSTLSAVKSIVFGKNGLVVKTTLVQNALDVVVSDETPTPLSIFNVAGQQVLNIKAQGAQRLDVSALPSGLYVIRTATGDVGRFVKQ